MWVFDLASAQWTRRMTTYKAFHSLYPSLLAIDEDSRVYDLCDEQESGDVEIALVTRAVKLLPDVLKRITCWALRCSDDDAALSLRFGERTGLRRGTAVFIGPKRTERFPDDCCCVHLLRRINTTGYRFRDGFLPVSISMR